MKLRVARHTTDLNAISHFYTQSLGMQVLGSFTGHDGYDGIFLGLPDEDWHLEFTVSGVLPVHQPDEDDLLVFYPDSVQQYRELIERFEKARVPEIIAKNPYWSINGHLFADPDGYGVMVVKS